MARLAMKTACHVQCSACVAHSAWYTGNQYSQEYEWYSICMYNCTCIRMEEYGYYVTTISKNNPIVALSLHRTRPRIV